MSNYALGLLGLPGTGKSSALPFLCSADTGLSACSTAQFHTPGARMTNYIARLFVDGQHDVALTCQVEALAQRAILQKSAATSDCIDEPIEAVLAHTNAMRSLRMLAQEQYDSWSLLYKVVRDTLPDACHLAILTCERQELRRRASQRGRLRDQSVSDEYLNAFHEGLWAAAHGSGSTVIVVDTTILTPREVASSILRQISVCHPDG
jgi:broad-specificity NMP kinase